MTDEGRARYLELLGPAIGRTDWRLLAYALMSSHIHLVVEAGRTVPWRLYQPLHQSFSQWLNRKNGRLGPVFAVRPTAIHVPRERSVGLITYVHNNPVRARLAASPDEAVGWTSHRAVLGLEPPPAALDVHRSLELMGFESTVGGRARFHETVLTRAEDPRSPEWSGDFSPRVRAATRAALALPVELGDAQLGPAPLSRHHNIEYPGGRPPVEARWGGDLAALVACVAERLRLPLAAILSHSRLQPIVLARRIVSVAAVYFLRRTTLETAAALAVSTTAVSHHLALAQHVLREASEVAAIVRGDTEQRRAA